MSRTESIKVSLRLRPLLAREKERRERDIWTLAEQSVMLKPRWADHLVEQNKLSTPARVYQFNHCFGPDCDTYAVYKAEVEPVAMATLDGFNGTVFLYGQTGSGKTYTMMGHGGPQRGILHHALDALFQKAAELTAQQVTFSCSYLEIYNEQVYDLLQPETDYLAVYDDPQRGFYVKDLSQFAVTSYTAAMQFVAAGEQVRKYAHTAMNRHSSRSHTIFQLFVTTEGQSNTYSVLNFVDLAGAERVSTLLHTEGLRRRKPGDMLLAEGKHINTSLFYLCQVIQKLAGKADAHVPYRNSNLTKILRSSLGGNALTAVICTATPTLSQFEMTLSTLRFGGTASTVMNTASPNVHSRTLPLSSSKIHRVKPQEPSQLQNKMQALLQIILQQNRPKTETPLLWCPGVGDLIVDSHLTQPTEPPLSRFDERGLLALERLKQMRTELQGKNEELSQLKGPTITNLKNELKHSLNLCQEVTEERDLLQTQCHALQKEVELLKARLGLIEDLDGIHNLSVEKLESLESFFFNALDSVKSAKFRLKYNDDFRPLMESNRTDPPKRTPDSLWKTLEMHTTPQESVENSPGLETILPSKTWSDHSSSLAFASLFENESRLSPIPKQFY